MASVFKRNDLRRLRKDELYDIAKQHVREDNLKKKAKTDLIDIILFNCATPATATSTTNLFDFENYTDHFHILSDAEISSVPNLTFSDIYSHITGRQSILIC